MDVNAAWVDERINERINEKLGPLAEALETFAEACTNRLDRHDAKLKGLRDELDIRINLGRQVVKLKAEIAEARRQEPDFRAELDDLRKQTVEQQAIILKLRGEACQLRYALDQLETEQRQSHQRLKMTAIEVTSVGSATREVLQRLQEVEGFELMGEVGSPSGLVS